MAEQQSTTDSINHLVDKVGDGLAQITTAISSHAPQAWELVVRGAWARALAGEMSGVLFLLFSCGAFYLVYRLFEATPEPDSAAEVACIVMGVFVSIGGVICCIAGLADIEGNLAMLIAPDAVLARDLLMKAL